MSTEYQVTIVMSQPTIDALMQNGFSLYAFKAVQAGPPGGVPVVWYQTNQFGSSTVIEWTEAYQAYTSTTGMMPGITISPTFSAPIEGGQTLAVNTPFGGGQVSPGGAPGAMSIMNQTPATFTCGIAQSDPNGNPSPVCALSAFPNTVSVFLPQPQILLMFATVPLNPGTVVNQAFGAGILVNLAGSPVQTVSYDLNAGWSCEGGNCTPVQPNQPLAPILIPGL
jgi:hypothetical protein